MPNLRKQCRCNYRPSASWELKTPLFAPLGHISYCLGNFLLSKFHLPKKEASSVLSQFSVKPGCRRDRSLTSQVRMRETARPWREMKMEMWPGLPGQRGKSSSGRVLVMSWVVPAEMTVPRGGLKVSAERSDIVIWAWSQVAQS